MDLSDRLQVDSGRLNTENVGDERAAERGHDENVEKRFRADIGKENGKKKGGEHRAGLGKGGGESGPFPADVRRKYLAGQKVSLRIWARCWS